MKIAETTLEAFMPYLEQTFRLSAGGDVSFEAELIDASAMGEKVGPSGRAPFSLVLRGPEIKEPLQQVYTVQNEEFGSVELFLVPIGPDDKGMKYEAVFT